MSAENVEIVRRHLEAFLRGDNEAALAAYAPDSAFDATVRPDGGVFHGPAGIAEAMRTWTGTFEDWNLEIKELVDAGDRVLLVDRQTGRGKESGVEIDEEIYTVFTLHDGKIVHAKFFFDKDRALDAAGLHGPSPGRDYTVVARELLATVARLDLDRLLELTDPKVEWRSFFAVGTSGEYHGHDELRQYVRDLREAWEWLRPEPENLLGTGDVVVGVGTIYYCGKGSGVESESRAGWVFKFRDGRLVLFRAFRDPEKALEQVGRPE